MVKKFFVGMMFLLLVLGTAGTARALDIAGIVVDEAGKNIADARVVVLGQDMKFLGKIQIKAETKSGADGKFAITLKDEKTDARALQVTATHPNYGISSQYGYELTQAGKSLADYRLVMAKRGFIQGKVVDATDKPVKDAEITVILTKKPEKDSRRPSIQMPDKSLLSAKTGADGSFKLDGLPQDTMAIVRVMHPDFVVGVVGIPENQQVPMGTIAVGSTDTLVKLQPGATVEGKITWEGTGAPVANVSVMAYPGKMTQKASLGIPMPAETDAKGGFVLKSLAPGSYTLRVMTFKEGVIAPKTVEVAQAAKMTGQDLTASKGVRVAGKFVKKDSKEPVTGASVYVRSKNESNIASPIEVKPDGTFEGYVAPGEVILGANIQNGSLTENQKNLTLVAGKDQTDIVFEVKPPLMFKGRVLGADGKPVAGAKVFSKWSGNEKPVLSNQEGLYEYPLPSYMNFQNRGMSFFLEASHPDKPGLRGMLGISISGEDDLKGDIVLTPVAIIRGKVLDKDGKPVPNSKVSTTYWTENSGMGDHNNVECDATGQFEIKDAVGNAKYSVTATAEKYGQAQAEQTVVEPGKTWDVGTLTIPVADKSIEGTVKDEEGKPVAGVDINCWANETGNRNTKSDAKGHFKLENIVEEETIRINAWHNGPKGQLYADASATAGDTDVELTLMDQSNRSRPEEDKAVSLANKEAPALDVATWIAGEAVTLESLRGAPVVLAFCKSDDKASEELVAVLNKICAKFPKIPVLMVCNADADQAALKKSIADLGVKFRVAVDKPGSKGGTTIDKYKPRMPAVYLVNAEGKVQYQDPAFPVLEKVLQSMVDGK